MNYSLGLEVIVSVNAVEPTDEYVEVVETRTWRERLLTFWPWRPWVKYRRYKRQVMKPIIYRLGNKLVCHPSLWDNLQRQLEGANYGRPK